MNYELLHQLIDQYEQYEKEGGLPDLSSFAFWLNIRLQKKSFKMQDTASNEEIAIGLGLLNKHARHYIKTALQETPLLGGDDFAFMATLFEEGDLRKSELIRYNLLDFSPGMEVIRRLIRNELIKDYNDPDDGRSKKVTPTEKGRVAFADSLLEMRKASNIISGVLNEDEKGQFVLLARKLLHFHHEIWQNDQSQPLDNIAEKYLKP